MLSTSSPSRLLRIECPLRLLGDMLASKMLLPTSHGPQTVVRVSRKVFLAAFLDNVDGFTTSFVSANFAAGFVIAVGGLISSLHISVFGRKL